MDYAKGVYELIMIEKIISVTLLEALQRAKCLREEADYYNRWSEAGCQKLLKAAEIFLDKASQIISKKN